MYLYEEQENAQTAVILGIVGFIIIVLLLALWSWLAGKMTTTAIGIEIFAYGGLLIIAVNYLFQFREIEFIKHRMRIPAAVAASAILGCTIYGSLSGNWNLLLAGILVGIFIALKGLIGPLGTAISFCAASYAWLHNQDYVPIFHSILTYAIGAVSHAFEYIAAVIIGIYALINALAGDAWD